MLIYLFGEIERERAGEGQGERLRSRFHAVGSKPDAGLDLRNREITT